MYGFHKRVGLSDNSMKASERKNKSPSEYYNPYFKRGHPNLLWLINKPKGGSSQKKGKGARVKTEDGVDGESEDEGREVEDNYVQAYGQNSMQSAPRAISAVPEVGPLQRRDMAIVQNQLQEIQKQQSAISNAISRLRKDHNQLYQQAVAFQTLHDRHESSINAILTFLATVYNRSLDGQGGPNIAQMFANAIPQDQQQGNVVDIGDVNNQQQQQNPGNLSPHRRAQRLLMAPPGVVSPASSVQSPITGNQFQSTPNPSRSGSRPGAVEELFETSPSDSPQVKVEPHNIINIINNTNAQVSRLGTKSMAFPDVLTHYENANGNSPLTSEQRNNMLHLIAGTSADGSNNALVSPTPPPPPSLEQLGYTQAEIEELVRMQQEQEAKLGEVSALIQPLSPSGSIPGLNDGNYFADAQASPSVGGNLDLDQFLDTGAYYTNGDGGDYGYDNFGEGAGGNSSFDFGLDGVADVVDGAGDSGRIVETGGSSDGSSPVEIKDEAQTGSIRSPTKRRRKG
jgi:heat shock transcription factor, other eukaryote